MILYIYRLDDVPVGVPAKAAPRRRILSTLHQMDEPGEGCL
jgi:hypothetical protein